MTLAAKIAAADTQHAAMALDVATLQSAFLAGAGRNRYTQFLHSHTTFPEGLSTVAADRLSAYPEDHPADEAWDVGNGRKGALRTALGATSQVAAWCDIWSLGRNRGWHFRTAFTWSGTVYIRTTSGGDTQVHDLTVSTHIEVT